MKFDKRIIVLFIAFGAFVMAHEILLLFPQHQQVALIETQQTMTITSASFDHRGIIPEKYTCDGENINPEFIVSDLPVGTKSLAIIMDDPYAPGGTFTYWLAWNIDPTIERIREGEGSTVGVQGTTSFNTTGYGGPCPPPGKPHRYFFSIYAMDAILALPDAADRPVLEEAIEEHKIDRGEYIGTFGRKKE